MTAAAAAAGTTLRATDKQRVSGKFDQYQYSITERDMSHDETSDQQQFNGGAENQDLAGNGGATEAAGEGAGYSGEGSEYIASEEAKPKISPITLAMVGVIALGAAGVWFMYQKAGGPAAANAATAAETAQAKKTINSFLDNGGQNVKNMEQMLKDTEKYVQQFLNPMVKQVPLAELHLNPFRTKASDGKPDDAGNARKREEERLAMLKAVQALQLQSVMYGETRKACMINNALYKEGQQVDSFTIEKITANTVIVKNGVYRFELKMQR